jgi:hypothetical protein
MTDTYNAQNASFYSGNTSFEYVTKNHNRMKSDEKCYGTFLMNASSVHNGSLVFEGASDVRYTFQMQSDCKGNPFDITA